MAEVTGRLSIKMIVKTVEEKIEGDDKLARVPMIIAMKGHPGTGKTTMARSLATSLNIPIIDKDDVRDSTLPLQRDFSLDASVLNDLSYEIIYRIASTQLQLGLSVILDSPLSRRAHLDRLLQLASFTGARVVVVECRPSDEGVWRRRLERRGAEAASWHKPATWRDLEALLQGYGGCTEYDLGGVPRVVVDTSADDVGVDEIVRFIQSHTRGGDGTLGSFESEKENGCLVRNV